MDLKNILSKLDKLSEGEAVLNKPVGSYKFKKQLGATESVPKQGALLGTPEAKSPKQTKKLVGANESTQIFNKPAPLHGEKATEMTSSNGQWKLKSTTTQEGDSLDTNYVLWNVSSPDDTYDIHWTRHEPMTQEDLDRWTKIKELGYDIAEHMTGDHWSTNWDHDGLKAYAAELNAAENPVAGEPNAIDESWDYEDHPFKGGVKAKNITKSHVPLIWENMLGTVFARNPSTGKEQYFDYKWAEARKFAMVDQCADLRLSRRDRSGAKGPVKLYGIPPAKEVQSENVTEDSIKEELLTQIKKDFADFLELKNKKDDVKKCEVCNCEKCVCPK